MILPARNPPSVDDGGSVHPMLDGADEEMELHLGVPVRGKHPHSSVWSSLPSRMRLIICAKTVKELLLYTIWIPQC